LAAGMDDHIGKPISPPTLLRAISKWSQGRALASEDTLATG
jgi:CheY-like chemotaxis protein